MKTTETSRALRRDALEGQPSRSSISQFALDLLDDLDEAIRERDEARGDFDGLMEAIEATSPRKAAAISFSAARVVATRRSLVAEIENLRASLAARDQAVSAAAATVSEMRAERERVEQSLRDERGHATDLFTQRNAAEQEAAAWRAAGQDVVDMFDPMKHQASPTSMRLCAQAAKAAHVEVRKEFVSALGAIRDVTAKEHAVLLDLVKMEQERDAARDATEATTVKLLDAERTLEAVREELRNQAAEVQCMRAERDLALEYVYADSKTMLMLRRRLSEQAREKDPQRNVTAGLLQVEQERCRRYDEINWSLIEQRQQAWVARDQERSAYCVEAALDRAEAEEGAAPTPFSDALAQAEAAGSATLVGPGGSISITRIDDWGTAAPPESNFGIDEED